MGIKSVDETARDGFPAGLRVLVVDDDYLTLRVIEMFMKGCKYEAVVLTRATDALNILHERQGGFDVIITDIYMPIMGGFEFLQIVKKEFNIPVIMISSDDQLELMAKGMRSGAHSFLVKPVTKDFVENLWQYVFLKAGGKGAEGTIKEGLTKKEEPDHSSSVNLKKRDEVKKTTVKVAKHKEEEANDEDYDSDEERHPPKKARMVWTPTLHEKFVAAIKHIGVNKAVPKKILEVMNVKGVSRTNVASHLQKYRLYLKGSKDPSASKFWDRYSTNSTYDPGYAPGLSQFFDQTAPTTYPLPQGTSRYSQLSQTVLNQINMQRPLITTTTPNFCQQSLTNIPSFENTSNYTVPTFNTSSYKSNYVGLQLCDKEGMVGLRQAGLQGGITANMMNIIPQNENMMNIIPQNETRIGKRSRDVFESPANTVIPEYNTMNFNQATQIPPPPPSTFMNVDVYQEAPVVEEQAYEQQNETGELDNWSDLIMNNTTNDISYLLSNVGNEFNQENVVEGLILDPQFGVGELQFDDTYLAPPPNIQ
ncbi:hypothetical protein ACHQM5_000882 [Ranunculus cassubicifolius]